MRPRDLTQHVRLNDWIAKCVELCLPDKVHLCDGSPEEFSRLAQELVLKGTLVPLNPQKKPHSFWCRSNPEDVARVEENTFICSEKKDDAGPTNHWKDPSEMRQILEKLFTGCMEGRTMYVIVYCMGPLDSPLARVGVEVTDSAYVVLNMKLMTRMGAPAIEKLGQEGMFVPGLHSVGVPLKAGEKDSYWPCNPANRWIVHFPEAREIWSFGSGYGGNSLLGKKCFALRIASVLGRDEGWFAEHMLILGLTSPQGEKKYIAAAFPSACGKTNLAMMLPTIAGWTVECVGDDIAWLHFGPDGRLYAVNPESGYFGVAPGTSMKTNPNAMRAISHNTLFTNVGLTAQKDVWWEGMGSEPPFGLTSWLGAPYEPRSGKPAAHPNSRFTVAATQNPMYDRASEAPGGVPISAILFGGRRNSVVPLVMEAFSWEHGVFLGASLSSEMTAAAKGVVGTLRHDPFAMLAFCGYHMGDYFAHWLAMGQRKGAKLPKIYAVNWFRKGADGSLLWPGFGDNARVLKWVFERATGSGNGKKTAIGIVPDTLDYEGLKISDEQALFHIDAEEWRQEVEELERYFALFGEKFPVELQRELAQLKMRFGMACD